VTRAPSTAEPAGPSIQVNLVDSLTRLRRSVSAGVAEGEIRSDAGVDLNNLVTNLQRELATGQPMDLQQRVAELRSKIATRLRDGGLTQSRASTLNAILSTVGP